jgi:hypothetical protein
METPMTWRLVFRNISFKWFAHVGDINISYELFEELNSDAKRLFVLGYRIVTYIRRDFKNSS